MTRALSPILVLAGLLGVVTTMVVWRSRSYRTLLAR